MPTPVLGALLTWRCPFARLAFHPRPLSLLLLTCPAAPSAAGRPTLRAPVLSCALPPSSAQLSCY